MLHLHPQHLTVLLVFRAVVSILYWHSESEHIYLFVKKDKKPESATNLHAMKYQCVTDGWTDEQKDTPPIAKSRSSIAERYKSRDFPQTISALSDTQDIHFVSTGISTIVETL